MGLTIFCSAKVYLPKADCALVGLFWQLITCCDIFDRVTTPAERGAFIAIEGVAVFFI